MSIYFSYVTLYVRHLVLVLVSCWYWVINRLEQCASFLPRTFYDERCSAS